MQGILGVSPIEWFSGLFVVSLEFAQSPPELLEIAEVVWGQRLALQDGKVHFDLVEPTGVHRRMHHLSARPLPLESLHARLAAMNGCVVHDPEHALRGVVGRLSHHPGDQTVELLDPASGNAEAEHLGSVHVPSGDVGAIAFPHIFMFHSH